MKTSALASMLVAPLLVSSVILAPVAQSDTCYTVTAGALTNGSACTGDVVIDSSVTSISEYAFLNVKTITSIVIPASVTRLGLSSFQNTSALRSVTLNEGLERIDSSTFRGSGITSMAIPSSVTILESSAFSETRALTHITLGAGLTTIPNNAFESSGLTSIVIPSTVTSIGQRSFRDTQALASVNLSSRISDIPEKAFERSGLTSIKIPDAVTTLGAYAFSDTPSLKSVSLGAGITSIGISAFESSGLTSIIIPPNVTSISNNAFRDSRSLTTVGIGSGATSLGDQVFRESGLLRCVRASGNAPSAGGFVFTSTPLTSVFYLDGTTGWESPWIPGASNNSLTTTAQTLTPTSGTQWGGTTVTLTSCGLNTVSRVLIDGVAASFSVTSDGTLTAVTPVGSPGVVDVEIEDSVSSRQKVATYTFVSAPAPTPPAPPAEPSALPVVTPSAPVTPVVVEQTVPVLGNPAEPTRVAPGVILVSQAQAQATAPRVMRNAPADTIKDAPVVQSQTGATTALITPGLTPGVIYQVRIKVQGEYQDLGLTQAKVDGDAAVPVFRLSRAGSYTIVLTNPLDGSVQYIKVRVNKGR